MSDYYVQIRKGGPWHRQDGNQWWTWCNLDAPHERTPLYGFEVREWVAKSTKPQHPLCKRCERMAEKS